MPLLQLSENTYMAAFLYAAAVTGISTGIVLEYRVTNPFGTYPTCVDPERCDDKKGLTFWAILQTSIASALSTFLVLWGIYYLFGFGKSLLSVKELP